MGHENTIIGNEKLPKDYFSGMCLGFQVRQTEESTIYSCVDVDVVKSIYEGIAKKDCEEDVTERWAEDTTQFDSTFDLKTIGHMPSNISYSLMAVIF